MFQSAVVYYNLRQKFKKFISCCLNVEVYVLGVKLSTTTKSLVVTQLNKQKLLILAPDFTAWGINCLVHFRYSIIYKFTIYYRVQHLSVDV